MKKDQDLRSVALYRASEDRAGRPQGERLYRPYKDSPSVTLDDILVSPMFASHFDLVLLHDPIDGCLLVNLQKNVDDRVTSLPCGLHKKI